MFSELTIYTLAYLILYFSVNNVIVSCFFLTVEFLLKR